MRRFIKIMSVLLTAAMVTLSSVPALAAGGYTETKISLPAGVTDDAQIELYTHADGSLDLFVKTVTQEAVRRGNPEKRYYTQYHSKDKGKTWETKDTPWAKKGYLPGYMAENGSVYVMLPGGSFQVKEGNEVNELSSYQIVTYSNGTVQKSEREIKTNLVGMRYEILGILDNGDLVINLMYHKKGQANLACAVFTANPKTGVQSETRKLPFTAQAYANGKVYGIRRDRNSTSKKVEENVKFELMSVDVRTGQEAVLGSQIVSKDYTFQYTAAKDGTIYTMSSDGLFRFKPGASAFEKLLDGKACGFGDVNTLGTNLECASDGSVYTILFYYDWNNLADSRNGTKQRLYRYNQIG